MIKKKSEKWVFKYAYVKFFEDRRKKWRWRYVTVWTVTRANGKVEEVENIEYVKTDPVATEQESEDHFWKYAAPEWKKIDDIRISPFVKQDKRSWWRKFLRISVIMFAVPFMACTSTRVRGDYKDGEFTPSKSGNYEHVVLKVIGVVVLDKIERIQSNRNKYMEKVSNVLVWIGGLCWLLAIGAVVTGVVMQGWKLAASIAIALAICGTVVMTFAINLGLITWIIGALAICGIIYILYHYRNRRLTEEV